ncbi:MAG: hypothetical protein K6F84_08905 [Lachnospiraceae bacterium]|nr:hypothetical protein [Lachnospiraceae bacterium]
MLKGYPFLQLKWIVFLLLAFQSGWGLIWLCMNVVREKAFLELLFFAMGFGIDYLFSLAVTLKDKRNMPLCLFTATVLSTLPFNLYNIFFDTKNMFYGWGILIILSLTLILLRKVKGKNIRIFTCAIGFFMFITVTLGFSSNGKVIPSQKGIEESIFSRICFTTLWQNRNDYDESVANILEENDLWEAGFYGDNIKNDFCPGLEEKLGNHNAYKLYHSMEKTALKNNPKRILKEMGFDFLGGVFPPVITYMQLKGRGYDSCTSYFYGMFRHNFPVFSGFVYRFFVVSFIVAFVALIMGIFLKKQDKRILIVLGSAFILTAFIFAVRGAGLYDPGAVVNNVKIVFAMSVSLFAGNMDKKSELL